MTFDPRKDPACVLFLQFAERSGLTAYDLSKYGNHGTIYGAVRGGGFGHYYLYFDGVDDKLTIPFSEIGQLQLPYTLIGLFKVKENKINNLWTKKLTGETYHYQAYAYWYNGIVYTLADIDNTTHAYVLNFTALDVNKIFMVAETADLATVKGYLNGQLKASGNVSGQVGDGQSALQVGWQGSSSWYLNGNVYLFAVYNEVKDEKWIREFYAWATSRLAQKIPSRYVPRGLEV